MFTDIQPTNPYQSKILFYVFQKVTTQTFLLLYHPLNTYQDFYTMLHVLHALFHLILATAIRNCTGRGSKVKVRVRIWSQTLPGCQPCLFYFLAVAFHLSLYRWGNWDSDKKRQTQVISQEQVVTGNKTEYKIPHGENRQLEMHHWG